MMAVLAAMLAGSACAAQQGVTRKQCRTWTDPVLRVTFPEQLAGLKMSARSTYGSGDWDYSLRYNSKESEGVASGERHLDVYIYTRDGKPMPDGVNAKVEEQIDAAARVIRAYNEDVKALDMTVEGRLPKSALAYEWTSYALKFAGNSKRHISVVIVFSWRDRFVKLRYSAPAMDGRGKPCDKLPPSILDVLDALDVLIADAVKAAKTDVYAIPDPKAALEALRRKWLGADQRVSMWEMPDYEAKFKEIDDFQDWCNEDKAGRYDRFEVVCRDAINLRIEPAVWHYNLACALAVQKKPADDVFAALEQAVVAGYNRVGQMREDADLASVTNDIRFAKLCGMMGTIVGRSWNEPQKDLRETNGEWRLDDENVYYILEEGSYRCDLHATNDCPIVYLNHHDGHSAVPCEGLIVPKFPEEAVELRRNMGVANMYFGNVRAGGCVPTVLASNCTYEEDRLNKAMSLPAVFGVSGNRADKEAMLSFARNVLGIYSAASDYAVDGIDRFIGYFPVCIAHVGDAGESDRFVRLFRDIVLALPKETRDMASVAALNIIRHAQRCVTNEAAFMSGMAQRPVLSFADIDAERAVADASTMTNMPPFTPFLVNAESLSDMTPVTDLWEAPYDRPHLAASRHHIVYTAIWGEKIAQLGIEASALVDIEETFGKQDYRYVWKVLQGDEDRVRILPQGKDAAKVRIEVDYHKVFDVALPNGKTVKSSRVDVGCFLVANGRASVPAIVSVYFNPNETREYGADGRLVSIDYTKRQIEGWRPRLCAKGAWKDTFRYAKDGKLVGWTRVTPDGNGGAATNEFTREGLVVMTRDALGRPKDVRRDMTMEWMQDFEEPAVTGREYSVHISMEGIKYDRLDGHPVKGSGATTLAWRYAYDGDTDMFGKPSPKPFRPFVYQPELCTRAEFSASSGFRLPLVDQMMLGNASYVNYKYGRVGEGDPNDLFREDSVLALQKKGLEPPKVLKKMRFCPWKPGADDPWPVDMADFEDVLSEQLVQLGDGVYRARSATADDGEEDFLSVARTYWVANEGGERLAYGKLDSTYRRCGEEEVKRVWSKREKGVDWSKTIVAEGAQMSLQSLPEGAESTLAMWQLTPRMYFGIKAELENGFGPRQYFFARISRGGMTFDYFSELPSRAIGNAVLGADAGNADALNNFAVLFYAGVANRGSYEEEAVVKLLLRSAKAGNATAMRNIGVLYENRGERDKAADCYKAADEMAAEGKSL